MDKNGQAEVSCFIDEMINFIEKLLFRSQKKIMKGIVIKRGLFAVSQILNSHKNAFHSPMQNAIELISSKEAFTLSYFISAFYAEHI